ncbi:regulatory LuxR family protein [Herbihabitans rhizosphaerae]|uniref:Regulatory LuxR family protein n=1 Tax=Herbihabitans rhizosphaerae TaxID=1872711 RepID=A0A4V2ETK1_9PSEU|nr:helix-turn-helix transcriptional regulator [Herbihabitans rhizosphaerae]RZS41353.1 regulatory LuxR family protein [Herbihabitans rhizosphaerae]
MRAWLAVARGDWHEAQTYLSRLSTAEPGNEVFPVMLGAAGGAIRMLLEKGELAAACTRADRGVDALVRKGGWAWAGELVPYAVEAYCGADRVDEAARLTDRLAEAVTELDAPLAAAALLGCRAKLARHSGEDATPLFDQARQLHARLGFRYRAAQLAEQAAVCRWDEDHAGASTTIGTLADQFEHIGAVRDAARCRHRLRQHGIRKPSARNGRGYGEQMSPREREVARLVMAGHTNQEIADILFLSRRTVEEHVGNVLRKNNVRSRRQLLIEQK